MNAIKQYESFYDEEEFYDDWNYPDYKLLTKIEGKRTMSGWEKLLDIVDYSEAVKYADNWFDRQNIKNCFYSRLDI